MLDPDALKRDLGWIHQHFNVDELLGHTVSHQDIQRYYTRSSLAYRLLHSLDGAVHMSLSKDGRFRFSDYAAQVQQLASLIPQSNASVLELGCGAGFNLRKLSAAQSANQFFGVELTPSHARQSRHAVRKHPNTNITNADFHYLPFADASFDTMYDVESVCHSDNIAQVLAEAWRVLKPGGSFILFDGFRVAPSEKLTKDEYLARRLIEKSMAIDEAILISDFLDEARRQDFIVEECTDLASQIMPNLKRLRQILTVWRSIPGLFDVSCLLLPREMAQNAIAALLMPSMVGQGYQGYYRIILQKT